MKELANLASDYSENGGNGVEPTSNE